MFYLEKGKFPRQRILGLAGLICQAWVSSPADPCVRSHTEALLQEDISSPQPWHQSCVFGGMSVMHCCHHFTGKKENLERFNEFLFLTHCAKPSGAAGDPHPQRGSNLAGVEECMI